ncbi:MAG: sensor histidine kinase [Deltaproteobacteria bacterium]|nr:sensor histidine kinase [Deltaproteobacteria bacterium]
MGRVNTNLDSAASLQGVMEMAGLMACSIHCASGALTWIATPRSLGIDPNHCQDLSAFLSLVADKDRPRLRETLDVSRSDRGKFDDSFLLSVGEERPRLIRMRGGYARDAQDAETILCILEGLGETSEGKGRTAGADGAAEQLKRGLAEAHHRVKNSLQNILSLLNLQTRNGGTLSAEQVKKLTSVIHGVAVLHDLLNERMRESADSTQIDVSRVLERVYALAVRSTKGRTFECSFDSCVVTPRQASSLNVIFNELLQNALLFGSGKTNVTLRNEGERALLTVKSQGPLFPKDFEDGLPATSGLGMVKMLAKADLGSQPVFRNEDDEMACVEIVFPLCS